MARIQTDIPTVERYHNGACDGSGRHKVYWHSVHFACIGIFRCDDMWAKEDGVVGIGEPGSDADTDSCTDSDSDSDSGIDWEEEVTSSGSTVTTYSIGTSQVEPPALIYSRKRSRKAHRSTVKKPWLRQSSSPVSSESALGGVIDQPIISYLKQIEIGTRRKRVKESIIAALAQLPNHLW